MEREGRLIDERRLEGLPEVAEVLHRLRALTDERVGAALGLLAERRQERERRADGGEVSRRRHAEGDAARQAGQVADALERLAEIGEKRRRLRQGADRVEALPDLAGPEERPEEPLTKEPPAHRRAGPVHRPEERRRAAAVLQALHQLEVARGALVEGEVVLDREDLDAREVPERRLLRLLEVAEDRARRAERASPARQAEPLDGGHPEVRAEPVLRLPEPEARGVAEGHGHAGRAEARRQRILRRHPRREQHLRRPSEEQRLGQRVDVGGLAHPEVGRGHVDQRDAQMVRTPPQRGQEVVEAPVEKAGLGDGARRDQPDHLAPDELPSLDRGRLHLVADRDLQPRPDEPREIHLERVVRHPGHRDLLARGQRDVEGAGGHRRVLVERLVEVAEAEEQEVLGVATLPVVVLAHHRGERRRLGGVGRRGGSGWIRGGPGAGPREVVAHHRARGPR